MLKKKLLSILSISTLIVFVLSAVFSIPVLADSGTTPPATPSSTGGRSSNKGSSNSLSQVPSGTKVVILDSSGNKLPLGSQAAQDIINSGDPIWCPTGIAPNNVGSSGCSTSYGSIALLVASFTPHANGTIWVSYGSALAGADIDGLGTWAADKNFSLTIQGGWNDTPGSKALESGNPYSTFSGSGGDNLEIVNWVGPVTINNAIFDSSPHSVNSNYLTLTVKTQGSITLNNVQVNDADNTYGSGYYAGGAVLDNTSGTGSVTVNNSQFNGNQHDGLIVNSNGAITLNGITANSNGVGAYLDNCNRIGFTCATNGKAVTLTGTNLFDSNTGYVPLVDVSGLYVLSGGTITAGSLDANHNTGGNGVELNNGDAVSNLPVIVSAASTFAYNVADGLDIFSKGAISVTNLMADYNGGKGTYLRNVNISGTPFAVTVSGTNGFNNNLDYDGLSVESDGAISLNNITADYNGTGGVVGNYYDGIQADNSSAHTAQSITLTGTNNLSDNGYSGADFTATGSVTVNNVNAVCNGFADLNCVSTETGGDGLFIENDYLPSPSLHPQAVTLLGSNNISNNDEDNLDVKTFGAIKISNLTANDGINGDGANLYFGNLDVTGAVTLTGTNTFDDNKSIGLLVDSNGTVTASNLTANNNLDGMGVSIYNIPTSGSSAPVVTLTGTNTFNDDAGIGLGVESKGAITASNLNAIDGSFLSTNDGVDLTSTTGAVTLTGTNTFDDYNGNGLYVSAHGNITASNLNAINDGYGGIGARIYGVALYNNAGPGNVSLSGNNTFNDNYSDGIKILSNGTVATNNLTAQVNNYGAGIVNLDAGVSITVSGTKSVTLNGVNSFLNNKFDGLHVLSDGAITVSNITANRNGAFGAQLDNSGGTNMAVTLAGTNVFLDNGATYYNAGYGNGLNINSDGAVSVSHITADDNFNDGTFVNTPGKVTVTCGSFTLNGRVTSPGVGGLGTGWETGSAVTSINLISTDSADNFWGNYRTDSGSTSINFSSVTCPLP